MTTATTPTLTLTYLGHSAFLLEADGKSVLVDPFLTGNPTASHAESDVSPGTILITHAHNDHVGDAIAIALMRRKGFEVKGEWLQSQGVENATPGNHGGTIAFDGGTAKIVPAWHTSSYDTGNGLTAIGVPAGFVVRFGGRTLYFAGDTSLFGDMQLIGDEGLDVAVVPIGDHYTMGPKDALRAVKFLRPTTVVPCHYDTFPPIRQDDAAFAAAVHAETDARCRPLSPGESIEI